MLRGIPQFAARWAARCDLDPMCVQNTLGRNKSPNLPESSAAMSIEIEQHHVTLAHFANVQHCLQGSIIDRSQQVLIYELCMATDHRSDVGIQITTHRGLFRWIERS